jgi:hypothetical protein
MKINIVYPALFVVGMFLAGHHASEQSVTNHRVVIEDRTQDRAQLRNLVPLPPSTPMARALGEDQLRLLVR